MPVGDDRRSSCRRAASNIDTALRSNGWRMQLSLDPRTLLRMFWYRKWWFVIPAAAIAAATVALMVLLPPVYKSEATLLVEEQDIPAELVPSLVTDYIDRRLEILSRRVLERGELVRIIERQDLYPALRRETTSAMLAQRMRNDISVEIISTEVNDPRSGRTGEATIGFRIAFEYGEPDKSRRVVDELVSLFLAANLESRRDVATQTASFFASEREEADTRVAEIEQALADFQTENRELLPEEAAFKRELLANLEQRLQNLNRDLRSLRERESYLTTQLTLTDEFQEEAVTRSRGDTPEVRLEQMRSELAVARARYSASHPDVVRLQREVRSLEAVVGQRSDTGQLAARENALVTELAALSERYTDEHPDVVRVRRELEAVRAARAAASANGTVEPANRVRNSGYVQLSSQLNSVQTEIGAVQEQRRELNEQLAELQEMLARAPQIERRYVQLRRELESAIAERERLAEKATTVQLSGELETQAVGERLVLTEPATLPTSPVSPNTKVMLALGFVLATASGGFALVSAELLDRSVRSAAELAQILGDTPLAPIPRIVSPAERRRSWIRRGVAASVVAAVLVGGLVWIDLRVVPLDVLGFQALNRADALLLDVFSR